MPSMARHSAPSRRVAGRGCTSSASRQAESTSVGRRMPRALTQLLSSRAAAWRASSVFPLPGGPTMLTQREVASAVARRCLGLLASEAGGEHAANLSVRAPSV